MSSHRRNIALTLVTIMCINYITCSRDFTRLVDIDPDDFGAAVDSVDSDFVSNDYNEFLAHKRTSGLSLNTGINTLAALIQSDRQNRRKTEKSGFKSELLKIGKKSWRYPNYSFQFKKPKLDATSFMTSFPSISRRRAQQLSVSGPLSALANMLQAEGRRRKMTESHSNRMRLLELGKRSSEGFGLNDE